MRWHTTDAKDGDRRVVKQFAIFLYQIGTDVRWWETVYILQEYNSNYACDNWRDVEFVDDKYII